MRARCAMPLRIPAAVAALFACLPAAVGAAEAPSPDAFFRPSPEVPATYAPDKLYPQGRLLTFSFYSIRSVRDDWRRGGMTAIGPYYGQQGGHGQFAPHASVIDAARALGVKCFYRVGLEIPFLKEYKMPSDEEITVAITAQVREVVDRPEIGIWYVTPEELRYWRPDEMRYLKLATEAIRAADPQRRPIMLYEPNHRNSEALSKTLPFLDISSKGMYANATGFKDNRAWVRWGVEQEVKAIAAVKPHRRGAEPAPYTVLWMAGDPDPAEVPLIPAWARHDVYLSLVSGAKGIIIWSGFRRANFATFDHYLEGYASAARELNGPLGLGQVFLFGEKRDDLKVQVTEGPETQTVEYQKEKQVTPTVSHADLAYGKDRYLFLVNSARVPVTVSVTGLPVGKVRLEDLLGGGGAAEVTGGRGEGIRLDPYGVKAWRITRPAP